MNTRIRWLILSIAALAISGCARTDISVARSLATSGSSASTAMTQAVELPRQQLDFYVEAETMRSTFEPGISPPSQSVLASIASGQTSLALREAALNKIGNLYARFGDLANYDASGSFSSAVNSAVASVNAYSGQMGLGSPISAKVGDAVAGVGGLIASEIQKRKLREASAIVRTLVSEMSTTLTKEKATIESYLRESGSEQELLTVDLWNAGVLDAQPLIAGLLLDTGLEIVTDKSKLTASNASLKPAVIALLKYRIKARQAAAVKSFDTAIDAFDNLVAQHKSFEAGKPIDISLIEADIGTLKTLYDKIQSDK